MTIQRAITQSTQSATLADLLERILDKGIVIAGDIKIKLVEVELLTIQLRLVICSVDKAKEMGMDWWVNNPAFDRHAKPELNGDHLGEMEKRLAALEALKIAEAAKTAAENHLKAALGEAETGVLANGVAYTWKASERKGYVVEATSVRTLRRKEIKA